jgi:RND family efflux transporter MFP subunit
MSGIRLSWPVVVITAFALVLVGVGAAYMWLPQPGTSVGTNARAPAATPETTAGPLPDVVITLSDDAVAKAGVVVSPVMVSETTVSLRLAGIVEPNGYRQVVVAPLVSGRVTRVLVTLGDRVARNAPVVEIYSPELAEAQTRYLSVRAEFEAVEQEIARTTRLVAIGAASKQELEQVHAEHVRHRTEAESARTRLQLLGMTPQQVDEMTFTGEVAATTTIVSPIAGVVTTRAVNPGTTVDPATPLLTVVDLSTVWVVGDLYERDFSSVAVGTEAVVTTTAFPDLKITGTVAYIDPQVRSETRTAGIRVEVPNPGLQLRLGMYADVHVETQTANTQLVVPRSAVQNVADRTVVYLEDPREGGRFIEREVRISPSSGEQVLVLSGLMAGDDVVSAGSFFLRAERERLGLRAGQ